MVDFVVYFGNDGGKRDFLVLQTPSPPWTGPVCVGSHCEKALGAAGGALRTISRHVCRRRMAPDLPHPGQDVGCVERSFLSSKRHARAASHSWKEEERVNPPSPLHFPEIRKETSAFLPPPLDQQPQSPCLGQLGKSSQKQQISPSHRSNSVPPPVKKMTDPPCPAGDL